MTIETGCKLDQALTCMGKRPYGMCWSMLVRATFLLVHVGFVIASTAPKSLTKEAGE
jgi:hypothetical protein